MTPPPPKHWPELVLAAELGLSALIAGFQTMSGKLEVWTFFFLFGLWGALAFAPVHLWVKIRYADRIKEFGTGRTKITVMPQGQDLDPEHQDPQFQRFYRQQITAPWWLVATGLTALFVQVFSPWLLLPLGALLALTIRRTRLKP